MTVISDRDVRIQSDLTHADDTSAVVLDTHYKSRPKSASVSLCALAIIIKI